MIDIAIKRQLNVKWLISFTLYLPHNLLSSLVQIYQIKYNSYYYLWINNVVSYTFLLISIIFLDFMYKLSMEEIEDKKQYSEIWLDYEVKNNFQMFPFLDHLKRFSIIITLVFLQDYPLFQVLICIINSFLLVAVFLLSKPIENKAKRRLKLLSEIQGSIIGMFILIFGVDNLLEKMDMATRKNLGWIACAMTIFVISINLGYMIYNIFAKLIKFIKMLLKKH